MIFTVLSVHHAKRGYKLTGRFGEKGVIGMISPKEDMPISEFGVHVDAVLSPQGVFGRLNTGQWTETSLTFLSDNIIRELKSNNIPHVLGMPIIFGFLNDVNPKQAQDVNQFYTSCDEPYKEAYYNDVLSNGLKIHQPPFWDNCRFDELRKLYAKYPYQRYRFTYKGQPIIRRLTMGRKYIMLLKQTPESKYSVRSLGMQSALGHPSKSVKFKKYGLPNSDTPIRLGEMECINLLMMNDPDLIAMFLSAYANSQKNREALVAQIIQAENPFLILFHPVETSSINRKMLNAFFKVGGIGLID
jgi:DNA-directed RNA polymerase beta subunit